jgi:hypothetical protein
MARIGGLTRWARQTSDERKAAMARVREGIRERYRNEARALTVGADLTEAEIDRMAARLWYADNVRRAARATEARLAKQAAKADPFANLNAWDRGVAEAKAERA